MSRPPEFNLKPVVALTGASGFLGSRILHLLLEQGYAVRALQHRTQLAGHPLLTIITGNVSDATAQRRLLEGAEIVIHAGALVAARRSEEFDTINREATTTLVEAAKQAGVARFLFISSLAAREPKLSPYAASKAAAERYVADSALAWDILRPPAIYGSGDRQVLHLLKPLRRGVALLPAGDSARLSLLHVRDGATAVMAWVASDSTRMIYALEDGTQGGYAWREVMQRAAMLLGVAPYYVHPPVWLLNSIGFIAECWARVSGRPAFTSRGKMHELRHRNWVTDAADFRQRFGWKPVVGLDAGLKETLHWYKTHGWL